MPRHATPLKFLGPNWFAVPMGLSGLSLAWHRAAPRFGGPASWISLALAVAAALCFTALIVGSVLRHQRHPAAWVDDLKHPLRHAFVATLPASMLLLAACWVAHAGPQLGAHALWWAGSLGQLGVTVWVMSRWLHGQPQDQPSLGLRWSAVTPVLFISIVGNVIAPFAGVPLGEWAWSAAQWGVGIMLWPVVLALLLVRLAMQGALPERLLPTWFIAVSPPAAGGLGALQLGVPDLVAWAAWGVAAFTLLWIFGQVARINQMAFGMSHWAASFPLAAFAGLSLRVAGLPSAPAWAGPMSFLVLAFASVVITGLVVATVRGLREGSLLAPEPVASIAVASQP